MSFVRRLNEDYGYPQIAADMVKQGVRCFYCGQQITDAPLIVWSGYAGCEGYSERFDGLIAFHVGCTVDFAVRIIRDVHSSGWYAVRS